MSDPTRTNLPASGDPDLAQFVAGEIQGRAIHLADGWIDALRERLEVRPARFLPTDSVRDHVPELIAEVAAHLREPNGRLSPATIQSLRAFAELRRDQGYHESEVLAELGALNLTIFQEFGRAVSRFPDRADPSAMAEVAGRLYQTLDNATALVVAVLREREKQESRELSLRLAEFVRTLLHELRDPLNAATQSARLVALEELAEEADERLNAITLRNLEKIRDLLSDLSMVEDVEATAANSRWVPLSAAIEDVLEQCVEEARAHDVAMEVRGDIPDVVVDACAVEIPLRNLVGNAVKYSDPGEDQRWIRISISPLGEGETGVARWRITVADNGIGIAQPMQGEVFERGVRADPGVTEGSGLGLHIARQMARQKGGRIWFESTPGVGSRFHLEVREQLVEAEAREKTSRPTEPED